MTRRRGRRRRRRRLALGALVALGVWLVAGAGRATIEEQRARLPPAAECGDERVAGIWRSHSYSERLGWDVFTLVVRRAPDDPHRLVGTISDHHWEAGPDDAEPPPCERSPGEEWHVSTDAAGTVDDAEHIVFHGVGRWRLDRVVCRRGPYAYNLDRFSGAIDPTRLEFQSLNDDGGDYVNVPTVFRRVRCPPPVSEEAPSVNPVPPDFYPSQGGCGCR